MPPRNATQDRCVTIAARRPPEVLALPWREPRARPAKIEPPRLSHLVAQSLGLIHLLACRAPACIQHFDEAVEQVTCIVRSGTGFRVILNRKDRHVFMPKSLKCAVVEVDVGRFTACLFETFGFHRKAVVLAGDFHLSGVQVLHRLIAATVAEFELERIGTQRQAKQLMAQADAEYR